MASDFAEDGVSLAPTMAPPDPLVGTVIEGKYLVLRLLGSGGMGAVYEANHRVIGKRVAVKVLHREFCGSVEIVQRFQREARAATAIGHPNIVEVFDMGTMAGGGFFQVLELLEGRSLADELERHGPLSYARAVHILSQVSDALAATHDKGVVHRDLKPDNVFLVTRNGDPDFVKLLDFGVAKIMDANSGAKTRTGMAIGTPSYMSPEQAQGANDVDLRTDLFALGVMTFEMLSGALPFTGESFAMTIFQLCVADTPPLSGYREDVPAGLEAVIGRMLEKKKEHRYADCREVKAALTPFARLTDAPRMHGVAPERRPIPMSAIKRIAAGEEAGAIAFAKTMTPTPTPSPIASPLVTGPLATVAEEKAAAILASTPAAPPAPVTPPVVSAPAPAPSSSRAPVAVAFAAIVVIAAIGVGVSFQLASTAPITDVATTPTATTVRIALRAEPLRAALFVDEALVPNPYVAELAPSTQAHIVEARLEGYASVQRALTFDAPVDLTLALAPLAVAAEPAPIPPPAITPPRVAHAHGRAPEAHASTSTPTVPAITPPSVIVTAPPAPEPERPDPAPPQALKTVVF
jgi:serine/threonine protein kinase